MTKRIFDIIFSFILLLIFSPVFLIFSFLIWSQDYHLPFYIAPRVGKDEKIFKMIKFRSMIIKADQNGIDSTSANDSRITPIGHFIRKHKIDELPNLINVLMGQMSFVGPRPNVERETNLYTKQEKLLLTLRPGITDIASIIFSDEGDILKDSSNPDLDYNQLIRPWKSRLGIFYVNNKSLLLDIKLIFLTIIVVIAKQRALKSINKTLVNFAVDEKILYVSLRQSKLEPYPPPGSDQIVMSRDWSRKIN